MQNGDISGMVFDQVLLLDGRGLLYDDLPGWPYKIIRRLAYWLKKPDWCLRAIQVDPIFAKRLRELMNLPFLHVKILAFDKYEFHVLHHLLSIVEWAHTVHEVATEDEFRALVTMANTTISNRYPKMLVAPTRSFYASKMQAAAILRHYYGVL